MRMVPIVAVVREDALQTLTEAANDFDPPGALGVIMANNGWTPLSMVAGAILGAALTEAQA